MRAFLLLATLLPSICLSGTGHGAERVLVFAAASSVEALEDSIARYRTTASAADVRISFAATSALARQIEHGAPADLFLAANAAWMDRLETKGHIANDSRRTLFGNRLVLIAPRGSPLNLHLTPKLDLGALLGRGNRLALADPDHVPAGIYAKAALEKLAIWPSVMDRLARARDVRAALALVARGEAAAGIVYGTDAMTNPAVRVLELFPTTSHPPITYPLAIVAGRDRPPVRALYAFLLSPAARAIHAKHGFMVDGR